MNHFFAYLDRLKLIRRWGLMRNTVPENDMEHSMQTALIAHGLAVLGKTRHQRDIDPAHVVVLALYHDVGEVITGDLPTPVKYKTPGIQDADRISAYLKCIEEEKMGNRDFAHAKLTIYDSISQNPLPEVHEFMREFVPSFSLTPDELSRSRG